MNAKWTLQAWPAVRAPLAVFCVLWVLVGGVFAGCGYALAGRGSFLPESIKIIGVPNFQNRTQIFNLETQVTEKVRSEFIGRGRYTIVPESSGVDALLTGEVTSVTITPIDVTPGQLASRYVIAMSARVELRDAHENKVLWENPYLTFREEFNPQTGQTTVDPAAFFGQDANALERMTASLARTIVSAILEAF
jgi:hypothetical protein